MKIGRQNPGQNPTNGTSGEVSAPNALVLGLARLLADEGQLAGASIHFREVLRLDPRNETARRFFAEHGPEAR
jgi:hypothetical protein